MKSGSRGETPRRPRRVRPLVGAVLAGSAALLFFPQVGRAGTQPVNTTVKVSRPPAKELANGGSWEPSVSGDGRVVAFMSTATNLLAFAGLPGPVTGQANVFVSVEGAAGRDIRQVSAARTPPCSPPPCLPTPVAPDGDSGAPDVSGDGRWVAFESRASNLSGQRDTNNLPDVYLTDLTTGSTRLVSLPAVGGSQSGASTDPSVSGDGRFVAFVSSARLTPDDLNNLDDVFVRDTVTNQTARLTVGLSGADSDGSSSEPSISDDGKYVAFTSAATNLVPFDTNGALDVFVYDAAGSPIVRPSIRLASVTASGAPRPMPSGQPDMSGDGRFVVYTSSEVTERLADGTRGARAYRHDRNTGATLVVSRSWDGSMVNGDCATPSISGDGRTVAFACNATNVADNDTNRLADLFVWTGAGRRIRRVNVRPDGTQTLFDLIGGLDTRVVKKDYYGGDPLNPILFQDLSTDGSYLAFGSGSNDLVGRDGFEPDVFLRRSLDWSRSARA